MHKRNIFQHVVLWVVAVWVVFAFAGMGYAATVVRVDFDANNFFNLYGGSETPPESSLTVSFLFEHAEAYNYTGSVAPTLTSIDLEIDGYQYSVGEVGLDMVSLSNGEVAGFRLEKLPFDLFPSAWPNNTNDFVVAAYLNIPTMIYVTDSFIPDVVFKSADVQFSSAAAPVPIPPSILLLTPGLIGLVWHHKRRQRIPIHG
jgi:hypothetical protein